MDITDYNAINNVLGNYKPKYVINCAAVVGVEKCNSNKRDAYFVNVVGALNLALYCKENNCKLIHISTAYASNLNIYSKTKLMSESIVLDVLNTALVIKLPWVFGRDFDNYINEAVSGKKVNIFKNEFFYIAYDLDIVCYVLNNIDRCGVVNIANRGSLSREEIIEYIGAKYDAIDRDKEFDSNILIDYYMRPWDEAMWDFINESRSV